MDTVFVLTYLYDVENGGIGAECAGVFSDREKAQMRMVDEYTVIYQQIIDDGLQGDIDTGMTYMDKSSACIRLDHNCGDNWSWSIDECKVN